VRRPLAPAPDLTRERDLAHDLGRDLARDRALARDHASALDLAGARDRWFSLADSPAGRSAVPDADHAVSAAAERIVVNLVRLLPVSSRSRYREEFTAELDELAAAGLTRWAQLGHAGRLTVRIWSLRSAIRTNTRASTRRA